MKRTREEVFDIILRELELGNKIDVEASLLHDYGLDGDDAGEFMEWFVECFEVDMLEFVFYDYFFDEPALTFFSSDRFTIKKIPLTLNDLVDIALSKKWKKPERPVRSAISFRGLIIILVLTTIAIILLAVR